MTTEYSNSLVTSDGRFCAPIYTSDSNGQIIQCISQKYSSWISFDVIPADMDYFFDQIQEGQPLLLLPKPGMGIPMSLNSDGVLESSLMSEPVNVSFFKPRETVEPMPAPEQINYTATGTGFFIMSAGDKLCALKDIDDPNSDAEYTTQIIVCDLDLTDGTAATQFQLRPMGWSWDYKRVQLLSAVNNKPCGNVFFEDQLQAVMCPDHGRKITNFKADFSVNIIDDLTLPMSSGSVFGMQSWIEFQLPSYYWKTLQNGSLVAAPASTPDGSLRWKNSGMKLILADQEGSPSLGRRALRGDSGSSIDSQSGVPIPIGGKVYLKSTTTKKFCKVSSSLNRIVCNSDPSDVKKNQEKHTFIYNEFVPSS